MRGVATKAMHLRVGAKSLGWGRSNILQAALIAASGVETRQTLILELVPEEHIACIMQSARGLFLVSNGLCRPVVQAPECKVWRDTPALAMAADRLPLTSFGQLFQMKTRSAAPPQRNGRHWIRRSRCDRTIVEDAAADQTPESIFVFKLDLVDRI